MYTIIATRLHTSFLDWTNGMSIRLICSLALIALCPAVLYSADDSGKTAEPSASKHQKMEIEGWTVQINEKLIRDEKEATDKALELLTKHLKEIIRTVPAEAVTHLRKVTLWVNPPYPGVAPRAEYHPDAGWLKANRRNPVMAKGVEFTNVQTFEAETLRMPVVVLHELAHAYHDQVLGFDQADIVAAYKKAKESKSYDRVERWHGVIGRPNTFERAYAMTNPMEYFAESTEAFFGRNDFFPFTRDELEKHDPTIFKVLQQVWKAP